VVWPYKYEPGIVLLVFFKLRFPYMELTAGERTSTNDGGEALGDRVAGDVIARGHTLHSYHMIIMLRTERAENKNVDVERLQS